MRITDPTEIVDSIREAQFYSKDERLKIQKERLHDLVEYARNKSPYFKEYYKDLKEDFELSDIPTTSKKQLVPHFNDWITDKRITTDKLQEYFSDISNIGMPFMEEFSVLTTSGTTGEPLCMLRDSFHSTVHGSLISIRLMERLGMSRWLDSSKYKVASILGTGGFHSAVGAFNRMKKNSPCPENFLLCSILDPIPQIVEKLNQFDPKVITGYPSILAVLAKEKLEGRLKIKPNAIACSAEQLTEYAEKMLTDAFACTIANVFCSTEGGEVAFNCKAGNMHLNEDWVIMEPVDENLQPIKGDQMSSGVFITNLANFLQPIIRYYIGDSIIIEDSDCSCGSKLPVIKVVGRNGQNLSFETKNGKRTMAPVMFDYLVTEFEGIVQYQFVQKGGQSLELRVKYAKESDKGKVNAKISDLVCNLLSENNLSEVSFKVVEEVPVYSKGGKIRTVIIEDKA